jgi:hypothetical protein
MSPYRRRVLIVLPLLLLSLLLRWEMANQRQQEQATVAAITDAYIWERTVSGACQDNGGQWVATPAIDPRAALEHARCLPGSPTPATPPAAP